MSESGFYIAKISDDVRKCNKITDEELFVDIPEDSFSLYLYDGICLECLCVKDSNPLRLIVSHKINNLSYSCLDKLAKDISATLLCIDEYIDYIESKIQYNQTDDILDDYEISNNMYDYSTNNMDDYEDVIECNASEDVQENSDYSDYE